MKSVFLLLMCIFAVSITVAIWLARTPRSQKWSGIALVGILGGALGNLCDRAWHGYVVDFINYQIPGLISNVSNIADHAVVLGVILFFISSWRDEHNPAAQIEQPSQPNADTPPQPPPSN